MYEMIFAVTGLIIGSFCSLLASTKNRNRKNWFLIGFVFSFLAPLVLYFLPSLRAEDELEKKGEESRTILSAA
ncbi:MAG: hypothetical protein KF816_00930 [Melioribacteraceae bacterium]|nr:hypothetical protein [Melioribacteraceae bacterium]